MKRSLEAELVAFDRILRENGVPFPEPRPSPSTLFELPQVDLNLWSERGARELKDWFTWNGPESERSLFPPRPPFFGSFWKLTTAESEVLEVTKTWLGVSPAEPNPWVTVARDEKRYLVYNLSTTTVTVHNVWADESRVELGPFPGLIARWNEVIVRELNFDPDTLRWVPKVPWDSRNPIWRATGIIT